jgi:hypothetical protein
MSVTSVNKRSESGNDSPTAVQHVADYLVVVDSPEDGSVEVLASEDIPAIFSDHPSDPLLFVTHREAHRESGEDRLHWQVLISYGPKGEQVSVDTLENLRAKVRYEWAMYDRAVEKAYWKGLSTDVAGIGVLTLAKETPSRAVVNSANEVFDPPLTEPEIRLVVVITRYVKNSVFDPERLLNYKNSINNDVIDIGGIRIPKFCGWIKDADSSPHYSNTGRLYWEETWKIEVNPKTHIRLVLDQGMKELIGGDLVHIKDAEGRPVTSPVRLDGAGRAASGTTSSDESVYLAFLTKWCCDWSVLGLPSKRTGRK